MDADRVRFARLWKSDLKTQRRYVLANENYVSVQWQNLFNGESITKETLERAEELVEELRPESPLRFRLTAELDEIRAMVEKDG
jgi:hypothetical protein